MSREDECIWARSLPGGSPCGACKTCCDEALANVAELKRAASTRRESPGDAFRVRVLEASRKAGSTLEYDELDELPFKSGKALEWMVERMAALETFLDFRDQDVEKIVARVGWVQVGTTEDSERVNRAIDLLRHQAARVAEIEGELRTSRMDAINLRIERDEEKRHAEKTEALFQAQVKLRESDLARVAELVESEEKAWQTVSKLRVELETVGRLRIQITKLEADHLDALRAEAALCMLAMRELGVSADAVRATARSMGAPEFASTLVAENERLVAAQKLRPMDTAPGDGTKYLMCCRVFEIDGSLENANGQLGVVGWLTDREESKAELTKPPDREADNGRGLEPRYHVCRADGSPLPDSARCFVLRYDGDSDPTSLIALRAYAEATPHAQLATDLRRILDTLADQAETNSHE